MTEWSKGASDLVKEVLRQGETFLSGTVTIATAADQRAAVMAGTFSASAAAIVAGLIAYAGSAEWSPQALAVYSGGGVAAALFVAGAYYCVNAVLPVGFDLPGNQPHKWKENIEAGDELEKTLGEQGDILEGQIAHNVRVIAENAGKFALGARLGITAPVAGFVLWLGITLGAHLHWSRGMDSW